MKKSYIKPESVVVALPDRLCYLDEFSGVKVNNGEDIPTDEGDSEGGLTSKGHDFTADWGWEWN